MALTRPLVLPVWADTGDKTAPSNPEVEVGWPVTTIPPSRQRFNWFFNQVHNGVRYLTRRGLSDWSALEDYKVGDRCLAANGMTYRCLADHINIVPGTDATKWERWGFTEGELAAYLRSGLLSPATCPATGPAEPPSAASPYTLWKSVAPYNEYWGWLGDTWGVVWNHWSEEFLQTSGTVLAGSVQRLQKAWTVHRSGRINVSSCWRLSLPSNASGFVGSIGIQKNGVWVTAMAVDNPQITSAYTYSAACSAVSVPVVAGDLIDVYFRSVHANATIEYGQSRVAYER